MGLEPLVLSADFAAPLSEADLALIEGAAAAASPFTDPTAPVWNPRFVQSNGRIAAMLLSAARAQLPLAADRFGEWGSGLGLVTCLAARRGWKVCGIERDAQLVAAARRLAADHGCPARFLEGSYAPEGFLDGEVSSEAARRPIGDTTLFDFDLIYAYAWPAEASAIRALFAAHAAPGTILLLYRGGLQVEACRAA